MDLMLKIAHEHPENLVFRRLNQSLRVTKSVIDATELFMRVNNLPPELGKGIGYTDLNGASFLSAGFYINLFLRFET